MKAFALQANAFTNYLIIAIAIISVCKSKNITAIINRVKPKERMGLYPILSFALQDTANTITVIYQKRES